MHHSHVNEKFLLIYILFARRTHEHEGTFLTSTSFTLMHIAKIHVTHCLLGHVYAFTCSYIQYSHDFIHVGGAYACYMSFQSFTCCSLYPYLKLLCMCSSITKKGDIESTSAPWVILVININISLVGLILLSNMFKISSTMEWHGLEDVEPLQDAKDKRIDSSSKHKTLYFFILCDPRSH